MKRAWSVALLLLVGISAIALAAEAQSISGYTVVFSQVVHRNGVSIPDVSTDKTAICGSAYLCGSLVDSGMTQLVNTGKYARSRYNDASVVGANNAFFPTETYIPSLVSSYAVAYGRTLQSSSSFLAGVFPNMNSFYPAIISENATTNTVLSTDSIPPVMLKRFVDKTGLEAALQPTVDRLFTWSQLQAMATEAQFTDCTQNARGQCAVQLYQLCTYYSAVGQLTSKPNLQSARTDLTTVQQAFYEYVFGYDASILLDKQQGSIGQNMAQQLITNMRDFMSSAFPYKMFEYSTQDSVISPLAVTIGMAESDRTAFSPAFGEAYFFELLRSTSSSNAYAVHITRGAPSGDSFTQISSTFRCMSSNGAAYVAQDNVCPFDDFVRYIESTAPAVANGFCVVNQTQYEMLDCPAGARRLMNPLNDYCDIYRATCPGFACRDGYILNAADLKCYPISSGATGEYNVRMAQVVHRHGARAPLVDHNMSQICGYEYPCGYLNNVGIQMLLSVGRYARSRYNNLDIVESPFFVSDRYNSSVVYTRSTGLERTLQSAASFLHGVFPDSKYFFPVIFSVNMTTDFLLNTDPMPPVMLKRWENDAGLAEVLNPICDSLFTWEQLQAAADAAFIGGTCVDYDYRWQCALDVYDVGMSFRATSQLADKPNLSALLQGVTEVNTQYFYYVFGYNATVELDRTQGTMAQNIAQELLGNMYAHQLSPSYRMYEYSTHDTLVAPLGVTLGDQGYATMDVPYAQTYFVELLQDVGDDSYHVRVLRGNPTESDTGGNYSFEEGSFTQHCIDDNGVTYEAKNNICPLADFARFIDSTRPSVQKGYCIVNQTMYNNMECPASVTLGLPVPHYCQIYRICCGDMSCSSGYVLAQDDLQCYPTDAETTSTPPPTPAPTASQAVPVAIPPAKRMSEARRRELASGIVRGVTTGVIFGTSLAKHSQTA